MTKETANFFKSALEHCDEDCEIQEDYSGRSMFGKTTYGITFGHATMLMECVLAYVRNNPGVKIPDYDVLSSDNMGRDVIWY